MHPPDDVLEPGDFRTLMATSSFGVIVHDARTHQVLWANQMACEVLELDVDELRRVTADRDGSSAARYDQIVGRAWIVEALEHGSARVQWTYRSASGEDVPVDATAVRAQLSTGTVVVVQFGRENRDRQAEDALRLTATYVETLSRHTAAGLLVLAPDSTVLHATDRALVQFGNRARADMVGHPLTRFCEISAPIDGPDPVRGWGPSAKAANPIGTFKMRLLESREPAVWLGGTMERLFTSGSDKLLLIVHDISDQVKDQQRRAMELQQENYLARYNVMGDMAMAIAHELGQPLAAAGNFLGGVVARTSSLATTGDRAFEAVQQINYGIDSARRQIDRVSMIVSALRAFVGHLEHVEQTVDLNDVIGECLYFVRLRAAQHGVTVETHLSPEPVLVRCERVLTGQVVLNLCFNAIDELAHCDPDRRTVEVTTTLRDGGGEVSVDDRGRGVPRDPFAESFTMKEHGSGIGLALSYRIINRQHGSIWAERREGGGSTFGFRLPAA